MRKSLGNRLVRSFLTIIFFTVFIIDLFLILGFRNFYYSSTQNEIENRLVVTQDSFKRFYSDKSLDEMLLSDMDLNWVHRSNLEVQVIERNGFVLLDTIGALPSDPINTEDIISAREDKTQPYIGNSSYTKDKVMAITGPLKNSQGEVLGYIRMISSLEKVDKAISNTILLLIVFGLIVIIITTIISLIIAGTIVRPIKELTGVAARMANGEYKVRSSLNSKDELGQLAATLNTMAEEILNKEQIKNDFISSISHELRTPLTSIKGWAVVLKSTDPQDKDIFEDGLRIIESESDRLAKMVEELLDFSRFISGRIQLEKEAFNITDICGDVAKQMKPRASAGHIDFISDIEDKKVIVIGDRNRLRQLLINLLDNAIKFSSDEGWVKLKTYTDNKDFVILISDNGMGIAKEDLAHVKEKFYKGKHSKSHSGIGLSISDEIARLHDGSLQIFSEYKIGTTVKVTIPIANDKEQEDE
ncbi:sensor histidine kinase [Peptoniphilus catoniae]|uniref:sensor histidine kinase n=1 Tax=Peptoniphilus catoniae TaxID=1660341 RepID=UPI0010FF56B6|nr:HAMP domain-containing sensor histidine kinase [Peptoniphilus catoniae]